MSETFRYPRDILISQSLRDDASQSLSFLSLAYATWCSIDLAASWTKTKEKSWLGGSLVGLGNYASRQTISRERRSRGIRDMIDIDRKTCFRSKRLEIIHCFLWLLVRKNSDCGGQYFRLYNCSCNRSYMFLARRQSRIDVSKDWLHIFQDRLHEDTAHRYRSMEPGPSALIRTAIPYHINPSLRLRNRREDKEIYQGPGNPGHKYEKYEESMF